MQSRSRRTLQLLALGAGAALLPLRADACFYHWSHGLPEPTGVWPANLATSSPATADAAALVASAAVQDLDTSNASYITSWLINTTGATGKSTNSTINADVDTIPANVQEVAYTSTNVYIKATGIPDYNIGPFPGNPNVPANDNATFDITRNPTPATGTHTATGNGAIGVMINGVDVFNMSDAMSYQNKNVWYNNAGVVEAPSFDAANAHPQQQGVYHNHENPVSLEAEIGATSTNPMVVGYAIDGYPIMNDYASLTSGGAVKKMMSGYELRTYTNNVRGSGGPNVSTTYPDGYFEQDYTYVASQTLPSGEAELDQYNGAFVYTPQFPSGTYAYFATTDTSGNAAYPYLLGPTYYGTPASDDLAGTVTVPGTAVIYTPPATLTWNNTSGTGTGTTWDTTSKNWNNTSAATTFSSTNADNVTFNDTNNGHYAVTISTAVTPGSATVNNGAGDYTFAGTGGIGGTGTLTKSGTGSLTLATSNSYSGGTSVTAGTLVLSGANAFPVFSALSISSGAEVQIGAHNGSSSNIVVTRISGLTLAGSTGSWGGLLDLTNNSAIVRSGSISDVTNQIATAFAGGTWSGTAGITSSTAAGDTSHLTAVGVIKNDNGGTAIFTTFDNASTTDGDILIKYTYYGDANLDGAVDGSDYTKIDAGFTTATLTGWANGDFNYDGKIDGSDYTLIDNAFNSQGTTLGSNPLMLIADSTTQIAVPEPAALGLLGIATCCRITRRRRR